MRCARPPAIDASGLAAGTCDLPRAQCLSWASGSHPSTLTPASARHALRAGAKSDTSRRRSPPLCRPCPQVGLIASLKNEFRHDIVEKVGRDATT